MPFRNFLNGNKVVKLLDNAASATSDVTSGIVDTAGYEGAVIFTSLGTANATNTMKVQQNTANQTTGMADLTGTSITSGSSDEDLIVNIHQPLERYLQVVVARGVATAVGDIWCVLYGAKESKLTANSVSGTQIAELHVSPAEGTA